MHNTNLTDPNFIDHAITQKTNLYGGKHPLHAAIGKSWDKPSIVHMQSNDYLSIANDKRICRSKASYLLSYGHGDSVSRVFAHDRNDIHRKFEKRIAHLTKAEDAALVMSGYCANTGIVQCFAQSGTPVYIDIRAHASLWEGILSARAKARPFRHNNVEDLAKKIKRYGPGLVVVDSLYSTNGKMAPLADIVKAAEDGNCAIIVDETHSFGCHGPNGAGLVVELGLAERVHFRTIGLSKAVAARGGVVLGSRRNMEFFQYEARPMIFSTSVLGYEVAGFDTTLDIFASEPWRREKLHANHQYLKDGFLKLGYDVTESDSQILSIVTGVVKDTVDFRNFLEKRDVIGSVFWDPATPKDKALMRFTVNTTLTQAQMDHTLDVCADALNEIDMTGWPCLLN
ncbi:MAG: quorum-sensing autoinducer CAI-1 synthase [Rhodospirillales bacterium]|nr:quorum-sensing autoinducer CAI-1 synthase [Rhodospirillales bacterium]